MTKARPRRSMPDQFVFPFGTPVGRCPSWPVEQPELFVLGAYPSALHIEWKPPAESGLRRVRALPVDDEPEPFWNGEDADARVERWRETVGWRRELGEAAAPPGLNGSSGSWVDERILQPLGATRADAWITDCLDTYRASTGVTKAVSTVYDEFARRHDLPTARLATHPTETQIVTEALEHQRERLGEDLGVARPSVIVTLGNAALRVLRSLLDERRAPAKLSAGESYGEPVDLALDGRPVHWWPLAHPAAPKPYQDAHARWIERLTDMPPSVATGAP